MLFHYKPPTKLPAIFDCFCATYAAGVFHLQTTTGVFQPETIVLTVKSKNAIVFEFAEVAEWQTRTVQVRVR